MKEEKKQLDPRLYLSDPQRLYPVMKALASYERLEIMQLLSSQSMNVKEIAEAVRLPMSSAAMHIRVLEEAGLLTSVMQPGARGNIKLCSKGVGTLRLYMTPQEAEYHAASGMKRYELPIGAFSRTIDLRAMCGMTTDRELLEMYDMPELFYQPDRLDARILWFRSGFLEYAFPSFEARTNEVQWLEICFECNPQTSSYHSPWKSDISLFINDVKLGTWESDADRSVRRGLLTPDYWPDIHTQYGELKTWRITPSGCYLDSHKISDVGLSQLGLDREDAIRVQIGIESDAEHCGGLVLFGNHAGDFPQGIVMRIGFSEKS